MFLAAMLVELGHPLEPQLALGTLVHRHRRVPPAQLDIRTCDEFDDNARRPVVS
jgi:hypothetical protein